MPEGSNSMEMKKRPEYLQRFELHMKNGEVIEYFEDYDLPAEKGLLGDFKNGKKKFLQFGDMIVDYTIPFDQISYIVMFGVQKAF